MKILLLINDPRFSPAGVLAPKSKADCLYYAQPFLACKHPEWAAIVCFPGIMYRGGAEQKIRKYLKTTTLWTALFSCQATCFSASIATCIMVMKKNNNDNKTCLLMHPTSVSKVTNNKLTQENIDRIVDTFAKREEVAHFSHFG